MGAHRTSGAWQAALLHPDMQHHCGIQNPCVKGMICLVCSRSWHNTTFSFFFFLQKIAPSIYWRSLLCARRGLTTANTPKCLQKLQPCWWPRGAVVQTKRRTREKGWQSNIAFNTSLFLWIYFHLPPSAKKRGVCVRIGKYLQRADCKRNPTRCTCWTWFGCAPAIILAWFTTHTSCRKKMSVIPNLGLHRFNK